MICNLLFSASLKTITLHSIDLYLVYSFHEAQYNKALFNHHGHLGVGCGATIEGL